MWAAFGMGICFGMVGVLWLIVSGAEVLTTLFLLRPNPLSDTKVLLLYPSVPDLIFRFMSQQHVNGFAHTVIGLTQCITESVLIMFDVFLNVYSAIHDVPETIHKIFLGSECTRHISYTVCHRF